VAAIPGASSHLYTVAAYTELGEDENGYTELSPGSKRSGYRTKHLEYADAGIPHYWIVDITEPVSLVECHLDGEFGYQDREAVTGEFRTEEPFPVTLRLDQLL
jgi:Uma2 family endonuclease